MADKFALLGDEAVAMGAVHAGIKSSYAYPGTPATEIQEAIQHHVKRNPDCGINAGWSVNEKVAYEEAVGASLVGRRVLVNMKHVGVNVAADPFMSSAITGTGGGIVLAVGDDPSMHSSQNEQDSRFFAKFANIPCLEPRDSQEAYDMTRYAFNLSEKISIPVMIRLTTRISHTRSAVIASNTEPESKFNKPDNFSCWTLLPSNARVGYKNLLKKQSEIIRQAEESKWNKLNLVKNSDMGIIVAGNAKNYFYEVAKNNNLNYSVLEIGQYPLPEKQLREIINHCKKIMVIEDGYPVVEEIVLRTVALSGKNVQVMGRQFAERVMPPDGELNTEIVAKAFGINPSSSKNAPEDLTRPRPPSLCKGCPHIDTYNALNKALAGKQKESVIFGDIGCYTLGFYPPFNAIQACICMGASVSMAKAASENGLKYSIGIIGDSTFNHSGITPLLEGIKRKSSFTTIIVDNSTTGMTGGQDTLYIGSDLDNLILGLGIDKNHLRIITPLPKNLEENTKIIAEELEYRGPSVIIARRECIQVIKK